MICFLVYNQGTASDQQRNGAGRSPCGGLGGGTAWCETLVLFLVLNGVIWFFKLMMRGGENRPGWPRDVPGRAEKVTRVYIRGADRQTVLAPPHYRWQPRADFVSEQFLFDTADNSEVSIVVSNCGYPEPTVSAFWLRDLKIWRVR